MHPRGVRELVRPKAFRRARQNNELSAYNVRRENLILIFNVTMKYKIYLYHIKFFVSVCIIET